MTAALLKLVSHTHTHTHMHTHSVLLAIVALPTSKPVSADVLVRTANRCVQISETTAAKQRKMAPHLKLILSVLQQRKELVRDVARSQGDLQ